MQPIVFFNPRSKLRSEKPCLQEKLPLIDVRYQLIADSLISIAILPYKNLCLLA